MANVSEIDVLNALVAQALEQGSHPDRQTIFEQWVEQNKPKEPKTKAGS
jgi:hypothetical protein